MSEIESTPTGLPDDGVVHETPPGPEGDDSVNTPDDAHTITEADLEDADELDDDE